MLHTNAAFYADHPLIEYQHKNGAFSTMKNAFAMCLSDTALTAFEKDGHYAAVMLMHKNRAFSSFLCVLSNIIGCPIDLYFLISDDRVPPKKWNCLGKNVQLLCKSSKSL